MPTTYGPIMKARFKGTSFYEDDLDLTGIERHASLVPTLLQNDSRLTIRKQQGNHM